MKWLLIFLAFPVYGGTIRAECEKEPVEGKEKVCVVTEADLKDLIASNDRAYEIADRLADRVRELEKQVKHPTCGTLTVTEPSKEFTKTVHK